MKKPIRMEDFEKMEKVEFPQKFMQRTITITKKKEMNISGLFLQQLQAGGEQLFLDLRKSQDSRILAFRTVSDDGFEIPKSGKIKHIKFYEEFLEAGYEMPARYTFEYNTEDNIWYGYLEEVAPLTSPEKPVPTKRTRKRQNEKKALDQLIFDFFLQSHHLFRLTDFPLIITFLTIFPIH